MDQDRIRAILKEKHSYYGGRDVAIRKDTRWYPNVTDLLEKQLTPGMCVLDVGCGDGGILLETSRSFQTGIGIDNDPAHIQLAEDAKRAQGIENVEFLLLDYPSEIAQLHLDSFDVVLSLRGPVADTSANIQAALHLLHPQGLLFCEEIGELHQHEVREIFEVSPRINPVIPAAEHLRLALERRGVDVRLVMDCFTRWIYPDIYAWLQYQSGIWTWLGIPLPEPDDPRIALFAERNTIATGEIESTHHVVRVAGLKK
jgi:SAM-dependent methyltransferase